VTAHHSFLLTEHLSALEYLDEVVRASVAKLTSG
jgi:hypothetical protein